MSDNRKQGPQPQDWTLAEMDAYLNMEDRRRLDAMRTYIAELRAFKHRADAK